MTKCCGAFWLTEHNQDATMGSNHPVRRPKMTTQTLNTSAKAAINELSVALKKVGLTHVAGLLSKANVVDDREALGAAASLCGQLATHYSQKYFDVAQAALNAFFVLSDQANKALQVCGMCNFTVHRSHIHSANATLTDDKLNDGTVCGCHCQRRRI